MENKKAEQLGMESKKMGEHVQEEICTSTTDNRGDSDEHLKTNVASAYVCVMFCV